MNHNGRRLRTVIVGCGAISRKHLDAVLANADDYEVVGTYDIDTQRAEAAAEQARSAEAGRECRAFVDMEEMASASRADVAVIASPSALHADQACFWMEREAHLVLEKPVALCSHDMDRIGETQKRTGRTIAVGYVLRYAPQMRLLAEVLESGRFGRIFHVGLAIYWNRNDDYYRSAPWRGTWEHDGGSLMNQATHGVDILQWILGGTPRSVTGTLARYLRPIEADDFASATVTFRDGSIGTIQATVNTYPINLGTRLTILGESGTVELSGNGPDSITTWRFPDDERWREADAVIAAGRSPARDGELSGHAGVYQDLARSIANGRPPVADYASARVSTEIVLGILKSHREGTIVQFPVTFASREMAGVGL